MASGYVKSPAKPNIDNHYHSGHRVHRTGLAPTRHATAGQVAQYCQIHWEFGSQKVCNRKPSQYRYEWPLGFIAKGSGVWIPKLHGLRVRVPR